jgi:hypothetical protein
MFIRLLSFLCVAFFIANICAPVEGAKVKVKAPKNSGKTSFIVTDYFGYSDSDCSAETPQARYFGKTGLCIHDESEWEPDRRRKLAKAAANTTTTKKVKLTVAEKRARITKLTTAQKTQIAKNAVLSKPIFPIPRSTDKKKSSSRAAATSESKKTKEELKAYSTDDASTYMVNYLDTGVHGIIVTSVGYLQETNGDLSCDPKYYDYADSHVFPSNTCFDDFDGIDVDNYPNMGYTIISHEDTAKLPNTNGVLVS